MIRVCHLCEATSEGTVVTFRRRRDICDWCDAEVARTGHAWCAMGRHKVGAAEMAKGKPRCRACNRERNRKYKHRTIADWKKAHAEHVKASAAAYRQANREIINEKKRAMYHRDPEAARKQSRDSYARHRARKLEARKRRYWRNPEAARHYSRMRRTRIKLRILRGEA